MALGRTAPPFKRRRGGGGRVAVNIAEAERLFLAGLLEEVAGLLDEDRDLGQGADRAEGDIWAAFEASLRTSPPSDPAVARLLPDGSRDNAELAQSFRRLTEHTLRERKRSALSVAATALRRPDPVVLVTEEATALLKGLTDVRLVLAERLDLRTDEDAVRLHLRLQRVEPADPDPDPDTDPDTEPADPAQTRWERMAAVYEALTWWQESLVAAL